MRLLNRLNFSVTKLSESIDNTFKESLSQRIRAFLKKYAAISPNWDPENDEEYEKYTGPDPCELLSAAELIEKGEKPTQYFSSWESGCYEPYESKEGRKEHDDLKREIKAYINESEETLETKESLSIPESLMKLGIVEIFAEFSNEDSDFSGEIDGNFEDGKRFKFILQKDGVYHLELFDKDNLTLYQEDADLHTSEDIISILHDRLSYAMTSNESSDAKDISNTSNYDLKDIPDGTYQGSIKGYGVYIDSLDSGFKTWEFGLRNAFPIKCSVMIKDGLAVVKPVPGETQFGNLYSSEEAMNYWKGLNESKTYNDYPDAAVENAKRALRWREEHSNEIVGGTRIGWTRANQIAKRENLSLDTVKRIYRFKRHQKNSKIDPSKKGKPWTDAGYVAWLIWGGDEMINWAGNKLKKISKEKLNESEEYKDDFINAHITNITPDDSDVPDYFMSHYINGRTFELQDYNLNSLLDSDESFREYYESGEERYDQDEVDENSLLEPIVVVDGILMDGYSRSSELLRRGETTTEAYVAKKINESLDNLFAYREWQVPIMTDKSLLEYGENNPIDFHSVDQIQGDCRFLVSNNISYRVLALTEDYVIIVKTVLSDGLIMERLTTDNCLERFKKIYYISDINKLSNLKKVVKNKLQEKLKELDIYWDMNESLDTLFGHSIEGSFKGYTKEVKDLFKGLSTDPLYLRFKNKNTLDGLADVYETKFDLEDCFVMHIENQVLVYPKFLVKDESLHHFYEEFIDRCENGYNIIKNFNPKVSPLSKNTVIFLDHVIILKELSDISDVVDEVFLRSYNQKLADFMKYVKPEYKDKFISYITKLRRKNLINESFDNLFGYQEWKLPDADNSLTINHSSINSAADLKSLDQLKGRCIVKGESTSNYRVLAKTNQNVIVSFGDANPKMYSANLFLEKFNKVWYTDKKNNLSKLSDEVKMQIIDYLDRVNVGANLDDINESLNTLFNHSAWKLPDINNLSLLEEHNTPETSLKLTSYDQLQGCCTIFNSSKNDYKIVAGLVDKTIIVFNGDNFFKVYDFSYYDKIYYTKAYDFSRTKLFIEDASIRGKLNIILNTLGVDINESLNNLFNFDENKEKIEEFIDLFRKVEKISDKAELSEKECQTFEYLSNKYLLRQMFVKDDKTLNLMSLLNILKRNIQFKETNSTQITPDSLEFDISALKRILRVH